MKHEFRLQFATADRRETIRLINEYAESYLANNEGAKKDAEALSAGERIKNGERTKENFQIIFRWKLESFIKRKLPHIMKALEDTDEVDVEDALSVALTAKRDRTIIAVLTGLPAVRVRVASAVAAMIWPARFTVLDVRALDALGLENRADDGSISFYLDYLGECRKLACQYEVSLRTLDRALFRWSEIHPKGNTVGRLY